MRMAMIFPVFVKLVSKDRSAPSEILVNLILARIVDHVLKLIQDTSARVLLLLWELSVKTQIIVLQIHVKILAFVIRWTIITSALVTLATKVRIVKDLRCAVQIRVLMVVHA